MTHLKNLNINKSLLRRRDARDNIFTLQLNIRSNYSNYSNNKAILQYKKFVTQT